MYVKDNMVSSPITIGPDQSVSEAIDIMSENELHRLPVVDENGKLVGLVTEGVITVNRVVEYAQDYVGENQRYEEWNNQKDGASLISRLLFEEASDINFYVGKAINPAHQNPNLPINFNIKMNLVRELSEALKKMGKRVIVSYF